MVCEYPICLNIWHICIYACYASVYTHTWTENVHMNRSKYKNLVTCRCHKLNIYNSGYPIIKIYILSHFFFQYFLCRTTQNLCGPHIVPTGWSAGRPRIFCLLQHWFDLTNFSYWTSPLVLIAVTSHLMSPGVKELSVLVILWPPPLMENGWSWSMPLITCQYALVHFLRLTHWGRVTHICVSKLSILGSDNGLSPGRRQAII